MDEALTDASIVTVARAARALHMDRSCAVRWMRRHGLIVDIEGRQRVVWGSLMGVLREQISHQADLAAAGRPVRPRSFGGRSRVSLA
jgi:hypothetical protein